MKIAVMGSGGVGGFFGGRLANAGCDVHFVARGAHLGLKDAEARNRDLAALFELADDALYHGLDSALGVGLGSAQDAVHLLCDILLIHTLSINC